MRPYTLALAGLALTAGAMPGLADTIQNVEQMDSALQACWTAPADTQGSSVTLSFGLTSDGALIGPPQATAINVSGDEQAKKSYVDAATKALENCVPLQFAPGFAQGLAGNVYTVQFSSK